MSPPSSALPVIPRDPAGDPPGPAGLVSLVIATYNERDTVIDMIQAILRHVRDPVEVVIVDDDSPDLTWKVVQDMGDPRVRLVRRTDSRGLASAICRGIREARGDSIGWMDADMWMIPPLLPAMLQALGSADIALASRYLPGGGDRRPAGRAITSLLLNRFASAVLGCGITDYASAAGGILVQRKVLDITVPEPVGYGERFIGFLYRCCRNGVRVVEIPYVLEDRTVGASKSSPDPLHFLGLGIRYGLAVISARFRGTG
ncbi:MAG: glycosyltransferase [Methanomicrobiales archaeon]|nr:glycosyltransferase [Methanomicrobiales archaeon]